MQYYKHDDLWSKVLTCFKPIKVNRKNNFWIYKMEISFDILQYQIVKYLSYEDILHLCRSDEQYSDLCYDQKLWRYLLLRDFDIVYNGYHPKTEYEYVKYIYDISAIPIDLIGQDEKLEEFLYKLGYSKGKRYYILDNLDMDIDESGVFYIKKVSLYMFTNYKKILNILPKVFFKSKKGPLMAKISDLLPVIQFYHS